MLENLPTYVVIVFVITTIATFLLFYNLFQKNKFANSKNVAKYIFYGLSLWLAFQGFVTYQKNYIENTNVFPPKIFLLGVFPALITIAIVLMSKKGKHFIENLSLKGLTMIHVVRIPVEIVLFWLYTHKVVPELMTFTGRNFDILAGLSAPIIAFVGFPNEKPNKKLLIIWNLICLGLLFNIVINAILSVPTPIQQFAFEQPNIAVLYFPFSWLPVFIVPTVLFCHLVSLRILLKK